MNDWIEWVICHEKWRWGGNNVELMGTKGGTFRGEDSDEMTKWPYLGTINLWTPGTFADHWCRIRTTSLPRHVLASSLEAR